MAIAMKTIRYKKCADVRSSWRPSTWLDNVFTNELAILRRTCMCIILQHFTCSPQATTVQWWCHQHVFEVNDSLGFSRYTGKWWGSVFTRTTTSSTTPSQLTIVTTLTRVHQWTASSVDAWGGQLRSQSCYPLILQDSTIFYRKPSVLFQTRWQRLPV